MFNGQRTEAIFKSLTLNAIQFFYKLLMLNAVKFLPAVYT